MNYSNVQRRAVWMAIAGCATVLVTPFIFFPEIIGDAGVTHAGRLRNWTALVIMLLGASAALVGLALLVARILDQRRNK